MATVDEERYLRASLLLLKGTLFIVRKVLAREEQNEINNSGRDLDDLLQVHKGKLEHEFRNRGQRQKLFPVNGKTNVEDWDISLLTSVLLVVFRNSLSVIERRALKTIKSQRNEEFAHRAAADMPLDDFNDVTDALTFAYDTLAFGFDSETREKCTVIKESCLKGPLDIKSQIESIKRVSDTDDMFNEILRKIEATVERTTNNVKTALKDENNSLKTDISQRISNSTDTICKTIKDNQLTKSELTALVKDAVSQSLQEQKCVRTVKVVESEVEVIGKVDDKVNIELAEQMITRVTNEAIRRKETSSDLSDVREIIQQILDEISRQTGVKALEAVTGCVVIKFECASYEQLWKLLLFLESDEIKQKLSALAVLICRHLGFDIQLRLSIGLSSRTLQSIIDDLETDSKPEYKRSVKIPIQFDTVEGMAHVLNLFENGGLTNSLNKLSESLSAKYRTKLNLKSSVNLHQLKEALNDLGVPTEKREEHIDQSKQSESRSEKHVQNAFEGDSTSVETEKTLKQKGVIRWTSAVSPGFETTNIAVRPELSYKSRSMDDIIDVSKDYLTDLEEKDVHEEKSKIYCEGKHWTGKGTLLMRGKKQKGEKKKRKHGLGPLFAGFDLENQTEIVIHVSTPCYPNIHSANQMAYINMLMSKLAPMMYSFKRLQIGVCAPTGFKTEQYSDYGCIVGGIDQLSLMSLRKGGTIGGKRFKVVSRGQRRGYNTANVQFIHDKPPADLQELKALSHSIYSVCKIWYDSLAIEYQKNFCYTFGRFPKPESDDSYGEDGPDWHWWMVAALPIPEEEKVTMLASESYKERLLMLKKALCYCSPSLKRESMSARLETGVEKQSYVAMKKPVETPTKLEREIDISRAVVGYEDFVAVLNVSPVARPREVDSFCEILREAGLRLAIFTEMSYKTKGTIIKAKRILIFITRSYAYDIYVEIGHLRERIACMLFFGAAVKDIPPSLRMCPAYYYPDDALAATHHLLAEEGTITHPDKTKLQSKEKFLTEEFEGLIKEEKPTDEWNKGQQHENLIQSFARLDLLNKEFKIPIVVQTLSYPGVRRKVRIPPKLELIKDSLFMNQAIDIGACAQIEEHLSSYGCIIADMNEWPFSWREGVYITKGGRRFKVLHREERGGCDFARVRFIRDMQPADLKEIKALSTEVFSLCRHWCLSLPYTHRFHLVHTFGEFPIQDDNDDYGEDGTVWHWWMLAALPMSTEEKVSVLGMESYKERLLKIKIAVGQYKPSLVKADMHELMETSVTLPVETPIGKT